jgi:DUF1009 family protein
VTTASPIGLIAAAGRLPVVFAEKARSLGVPVCGVGIRHLAAPELAALCDPFYSISLVRLGEMMRAFHRSGVKTVVVAGKLHKAPLLRASRLWGLIPDWRTIKFWYFRRRRDNRDDTLMLAVIDEFERDGFQFGSPLDICPEVLVRPGVLTRRAPSPAEMSDVEFGWELAKQMGRLDVGQSVAVRKRAVLAVEAIEGTDRAITRAGELASGSPFVVVKVAKPQQDMRFDVPTVGTSTIETMRRSGGRVLGIEAGKTIILDEPETVALADRYGISIVSVTPADAPSLPAAGPSA